MATPSGSLALGMLALLLLLDVAVANRIRNSTQTQLVDATAWFSCETQDGVLRSSLCILAPTAADPVRTPGADDVTGLEALRATITCRSPIPGDQPASNAVAADVAAEVSPLALVLHSVVCGAHATVLQRSTGLEFGCANVNGDLLLTLKLEDLTRLNRMMETAMARMRQDEDADTGSGSGEFGARPDLPIECDDCVQARLADDDAKDDAAHRDVAFMVLGVAVLVASALTLLGVVSLKLAAGRRTATHAAIPTRLWLYGAHADPPSPTDRVPADMLYDEEPCSFLGGDASPAKVSRSSRVKSTSKGVVAFTTHNPTHYSCRM